MGEPSLDYPGIMIEHCGNFVSGSLRLRKDVIVFKKSDSMLSDQVLEASDLKSAIWLRRCKGYCLKLTLDGPSTSRNERSYWFDGLHEREEVKLRNYLSQNYNVQLQVQEQSLKGWNWGDVVFGPNTLTFQVDNKVNFEVPLKYVTACNTSKNEAALELQQEHDDEVSLMEIRFFVPLNSAASAPAATTSSQAGGDAAVVEPPESDMGEEEDVNRLEQFRLSVMQGASVVTASDSDVIGVLSNVNCLVPRGRYDMRLYSTFVDLHGKSYDYKIPYGHIIRAFLLPHNESRQMFFVVSVDPPLKQGQTRYPFVILQFNTNNEGVDEEEGIELLLSDEQLAERYGKDKLCRKIVGARYDIVCKLFRVLADRKITIPGSYSSKSGARCVQCSFKASNGLLYPLERGLMFIHKPPIFIRFEDIVEVDLGSGGQDFLATTASKNLKTFDIEIAMRSGATRYVFSSVDRNEKHLLAQFLKQRGMRVKVDEGGLSSAGGGSGSAKGAGGGETTAHDAYLNRVRIEGEERVAAGDSSSASDKDNAEDEDDENDEDFVGAEVGSSDGDRTSTTASDDDSKSSAAVGFKEEIAKARAEVSPAVVSSEVAEPASPPKKRKAIGRPLKKALPAGGSVEKRRRKKAPRDPNVPKRPLSAYMLWLNANRSSLKAKHPDKTITELSAIAGEEWRRLEDKSEWQGRAAESQKEYKKMKAAVGNHQNNGVSGVDKRFPTGDRDNDVDMDSD